MIGRWEVIPLPPPPLLREQEVDFIGSFTPQVSMYCELSYLG